MAKLYGTRFLGGSVGDVTFRRTKSGVVVSEKVTHAENPRTPAQQRGRFIVGHLIAFFTQMKAVLPEAFENKSARMTDTNAFVSANYHNDYPVFLPLCWRKDRGTVLAPYRVTDGYFPAVEVSPSGMGYRTDIRLGGMTIGDTTTVAQLSHAIVENNLSFSMGDEVVYLSLHQIVNDLGTPKVRARTYRLRLDSDDQRQVRSLLPCQGFDSNGGCLGQSPVRAVSDDGFCWIHYCRTPHHFRISTQYLIVPDTSHAERYGTDAALDFAIRSHITTPVPAFFESEIAPSPEPAPTPAAASVSLPVRAPAVAPVPVPTPDPASEPPSVTPLPLTVVPTVSLPVVPTVVPTVAPSVPLSLSDNLPVPPFVPSPFPASIHAPPIPKVECCRKNA